MPSKTPLHLPERVQSLAAELMQRRSEDATSYYLYDLRQIHDQVHSLQANLPSQVKVYYAVKANPHPAVLETMTRLSYIKGAEVASSGELKAARRYFDAGCIIYSGPAKSFNDLDLAVHAKVRHFHVESFSELKRLQHLLAQRRQTMNVLLRVNLNLSLTGVVAQMSGAASKFGVDEDQLDVFWDQARQCGNLNIMGLHLYAGSGILEAGKFLHFAEHCFDLVHKMAHKGMRVDCINLGGGFGIDYASRNRTLDMAAVGRGLKMLIERYAFEDKEILLELGRYLVGPCGYYLTPIIDIKTSREKKFILTAGGLNHFRRPADHGVNHPAAILEGDLPAYLHGAAEVHGEKVDVGGPLCTPRDFIARDFFVERARIGDYLIIGLTGAYGCTASPVNFLSHDPAQEVILE